MNDDLLLAAAVQDMAPAVFEEPDGAADSGVALDPQEVAAVSRKSLGRIVRRTARVTMQLPLKELFRSATPATAADLTPLGLRGDESILELTHLCHQLIADPARLALAPALAEKIQGAGATARDASDLWTHIGNAYYNLGDAAGVFKAFEQAQHLVPNEVTTEFNYGIAHHGRMQLTEARHHYERARVLDPRQPKIWCNLGVLAFQENNLGEAEESTRHAISLQEDYARAWDNLGAVLGTQERINEALAACNRAVELRPDLREAWFKLMLFHYDNNDLTAASTALDHCLDLEPVRAYILYYRALLALDLGREDNPHALCREAMNLDMTCDVGPLAWNRLADHFDKASDTIKAAKCRSAVRKLLRTINQIPSQTQLLHL